LLRPYSIDDAAEVWRAIEQSRDSLLRWVPDIGRRLSINDVRGGLEHVAQAAGDRRVFGIWERRYGGFLGEVGLYSVDSTRDVGEIGYWLERSSRGRGYAREALRSLLERLAEERVSGAVEARIPVENAASQRVVEACGILLEGPVLCKTRLGGNHFKYAAVRTRHFGQQSACGRCHVYG
jgi:RimJ/RimL family protein N-acetyltransferase